MIAKNELRHAQIMIQQTQLTAAQERERLQLQIEEDKRQIEELQQQMSNDNRPASIYRYKHNGRLLYIGKDQNANQTRAKEHLTQRRKIVTQYQLIDIVLASIPENEITLEIQPCSYDECPALEIESIRSDSPLYNQQHRPDEYKCTICQKKYQYRGWFERHLQVHA